ncbi:SDR family NAD(P)-dependent oxidoreductase [Ramlibacter sp. MAHUQ-53]|uniref:SDR family NAD(P)-dependent oxidoreductase n=1 Tax=unclassified Ramlibacter TaxID=2617605 RepID=UPI003624F173
MAASTPRHAVITGVSSGIGRAIALRLLQEGWQVTGLCRSQPADTHERLRIVQADVADPAHIDAACAGIGRLDALVHAAGFMRTAPLGELDAEASQGMWQVHVQAAERLANQLVGRMNDGGRIVLVGSRVAIGAPTRSQYAATKAALVGMARSWAAELAPRGITVNVLAPGATDTPFLRDPARAQTPPRMPPIGRLVRPEEVAGMAAFLVGPEGGAITGQQIVMCGGASL